MVFAAVAADGTGPNNLKLVSGSGSPVNTAPSIPKASTAKDSATMVSSGRIWPPLDASVGLTPQRVAMEKRRAIARPKGHRAHGQLRDPGGPKGVAVERRVVAGLRQRRHHIGERPERPALDVQRAAGKSFRGKTAARGFQQRQAGLQRERERTAARFHPLDAFGCGRARLLDRSHQLVCFAATSSRPRASSSSRTSRFGILP